MTSSRFSECVSEPYRLSSVILLGCDLTSIARVLPKTPRMKLREMVSLCMVGFMKKPKSSGAAS